MFQPVGGMDRIPYAFARELREIAQYGAPVTELQKTSKGVRVTYTQHGKQKIPDADFCSTSMPVHLLSRVPNNLSPTVKDVLEHPDYDAS